MHTLIHVSGLLISVWYPANSIFVRDKYVTPTEKRLLADYAQKRKHIKTYHLTPQLAVNNTCVCGSMATYYIHKITILTQLFTHTFYKYLLPNKIPHKLLLLVDISLIQ